ncbi:Calx-beta domain-containing protein [Phenylobacterium sp.]|uniref:Calx-beta domain-containing protein n=1 Tax=Phenylobacterium sp. TaxID=1871053 RepID=UPI00286A2DC8|nr:Calx-beta domain-containing protein [Phenylobacterium sp.]
MAWINEFHYDNTGADSGEFIEIAAAAGTDLTGWTLVRYNGNTASAGVTYSSPGSIALSGVVADQTGTGVGFFSVSLPADGIQNGARDGFALVDPNGVVVQLISYEGVFTASNGPANGQTSVDIGVSENGTEAVGQSSLGLVGSGDGYGDFTWTKLTGAPTPGAANAGQTLVGGAPSPPSVSVSDASVTEGDAGTQLLTFTITRAGGLGAFSVDYATANGTASAGTDYVAAGPTTLSFAAGDTTPKTVTIQVSGDTVIEPNETVLLNLTNATGGAVITDAQGVGTITNDDAAPPAALKIHDIQGTAFYSPILAADGFATFNTVSTTQVTVQAVVTAVDASGQLQGFFLAEETLDWDSDFRTSEGIFVMTRNDAGAGSAMTSGAFSGITVGETVTLTAYVIEYQAFATNVPRTFLTNPVIVNQSNTNGPLPTLVLDGTAGKAIPNTILSDDNPNYTDSVDDVGDSFDPENDALDFLETIEGMRVTFPDAVVADGFVSGSDSAVRFKAYSEVHADATQINSRGGYTIAGDPPLSPPDTAATEDGTIRGGRHIHDGDTNPDILELDFSQAGRGGTADFDQLLTMGDKLGDVTGVIDFDFSNAKLYVTDAIDTSGLTAQPTQETVDLVADARSLRIATFNVENLDPGDDATADEGLLGGVGKFNDIGRAIAGNLGSPDIICIEEMQDNNGAGAGDTNADIGWQRLAQAVSTATGMTYQWVDELPANNAEGGEPNGNIRVGFLYNTERVQLGDLAANATIAERRQFTDRIGDNLRDAGDRIAISDNQVAGIDTADWTTTRKSLLGEFVFNGQTVYVSANHLPSKGGSGNFYQGDQNIDAGAPANSDWAQRNAIGDDLWSVMNHITDVAPGAKIVAGGDFNEFYFYRPMEVLTGYVNVDGTARADGTRFTNLTVSELSEAERYTYAFDGRNQAIDHVVVDQALADVASYDIVHLNTGFSSRAGAVNPALSDHEPAVAQFDFRSFAELLKGGAANDSIAGFGGADTLQGGGGTDTLSGGDGGDKLEGGGDADVLYGDSGSDSLYGGQGTDSLSGGQGDDRYWGGEGRDVYLYGAGGGGADWILDFVKGEDKLRLLDGARVTSIKYLDADGDGVMDTFLGLGGTTSGSITLIGVNQVSNSILF